MHDRDEYDSEEEPTSKEDKDASLDEVVELPEEPTLDEMTEAKAAISDADTILADYPKHFALYKDESADGTLITFEKRIYWLEKENNILKKALEEKKRGLVFEKISYVGDFITELLRLEYRFAIFNPGKIDASYTEKVKEKLLELGTPIQALDRVVDAAKAEQHAKHEQELKESLAALSAKELKEASTARESQEAKTALAKTEKESKLFVNFFNELLNKYKDEPKKGLLERCKKIISQCKTDEEMKGTFYLALKIILQKQGKSFSDTTTLGNSFRTLINKDEYRDLKLACFETVDDVTYRDMRFVAVNQRPNKKGDEEVPPFLFSERYADRLQGVFKNNIEALETLFKLHQDTPATRVKDYAERETKHTTTSDLLSRPSFAASPRSEQPPRPSVAVESMLDSASKDGHFTKRSEVDPKSMFDSDVRKTIITDDEPKSRSRGPSR